MIVIDASALSDYLVGSTGAAEALRVAVGAQRLAAPHVIDLECASVLRGLVRGRKLLVAEAERALALLAVMPLRRYDHRPLLSRIWELRHNMWPYDAAYVALAEGLDVELYTVDSKFAVTPGLRCAIRTFGAG